MQKEESNDELTTGSQAWMKWAFQIQAIAQNGLTFAQSDYDRERYNALASIAAEMLSAHTEINFSQILELFSAEAGYATPKIDVRGAVFQEDKILLVKETSDQKWSLPGGWADVSFSPAYCVQKEVREESGFDVRVLKLIGLCDKLKQDHPPQWPHAYKCFFLCEITGGSARPSIETTEIAFHPLNKLPELSLHRVTKKQIEQCYQHYRNPSLPTYFD